MEARQADILRGAEACVGALRRPAVSATGDEKRKVADPDAKIIAVDSEHSEHLAHRPSNEESEKGGGEPG